MRYKPLISCMILVMTQSHHASTELASTMEQGTGILLGLSPIAGNAEVTELIRAMIDRIEVHPGPSP